MTLPPAQADFSEVLAALPVPREYFTGAAGLLVEPPRDILVFARRSREEVMDGGLHLHPRHVLCWCVAGGGTIMVDGALREIAPGQALLLLPYQQHYFTAFEGKRLLWVFISFALPEHRFLDVLRFRVVPVGARGRSRLERVVRSFLARDGEVAARLELALCLLVGQAGDEPPEARPLQGKIDERIGKAVFFICQHLDQAHSVEVVAREVHTSLSHLRRLFSERMGISLGRFILKARLNHALALLHNTDLPVGRIAEACGFGSVYAFSRAFRKEKGAAPSSCRAPGAGTA